MTSGPFIDRASVRVLKAIRSAFAADADALAFFGSKGIRQVSSEALDHAVRPPLLAIVAGQQKMSRVVGGEADLLYTVPVLMFLPRQTPVNPDVPIPAAPGVTPTTGTLTGTFRYRVTGWNAEGESWASPEAVITLAGQGAALAFTAPPGVIGLRVWRTPDGGTGARYLETMQAGKLALVDSVPDCKLGDELAPVELFVENLKDFVRTILYQNETLREETGVDIADACLVMDDRLDSIDHGRNLRVVGFKASVHTIYGTVDGQPKADE